MEHNLQALKSAARRAYELARLRRAVLGVTPIALTVVAAALLATRPGPPVALGVVLLLGGIASLWFGQGLQRGLAPGVLAGLLPLVATSCAMRVGHLCSGSECMSVCLPASALGGALSGVVVGVWALRNSAPAALWVTASAALLTGAMGCTCVGLSGVAALGVGFLAATPLLVLDVVRRRRHGTS